MFSVVNNILLENSLNKRLFDMYLFFPSNYKFKKEHLDSILHILNMPLSSLFLKIPKFTRQIYLKLLLSICFLNQQQKAMPLSKHRARFLLSQLSRLLSTACKMRVKHINNF
jgi:hypothetical protein